MNKYLMMSAAALLATTAAGSAEAGTFSVHFGTSNGGSYCDGLRGGNNGNLYAGSHVYTACGYSRNNPVYGMATKTKGDPIGKNNVVFNDSLEQYGINSDFVAFDVEVPIKAGNKWGLFVCSGSSCFIGEEGVLLAGQYAKAPGKHAQSVLSKLADIVRQHALKGN